MSEGSRKEDIADEDQFCDQQIIKSIMKSKEVFDQLEGMALLLMEFQYQGYKIRKIFA